MAITHKRTARLQVVAAQFLFGIAGLALITPVCFHIGFGVTRTSFVYLILIALVSLLGSLGVSVVLFDCCRSMPELLLRAAIVWLPP